MNLSTLLAAVPGGISYHGPDPEITSIVYDSRRARPGSLFVAVWHPGYAADRHQFARAAVEAGAAAVVAQQPVDVPPGTPVVMVRHTPSALGWLAAAFYGFPSSALGLAGVTGTDGKTTTCTLTTAILEAAGFTTGMVTTIATKTSGAARQKQEHTSTPEAVEIQALLAETVAGGGRRAVVEATSHALDQDRLAGCELDVAVVTRVTHEHLEYHGTYERYLAAKGRLIDLLQPDPAHPKREHFGKAAILNADDGSYDFMTGAARRAGVPVVRYGLYAEADVRATGVDAGGWSTTGHVTSPWGSGRFVLQLPGTFNVYNALAALAAGCALGAPFSVALEALAAQRHIAGRMERVDCGQPFAVVVDFAHTPDSLTQVLQFLRPLTPGKLIAVFGSAGERDVQKRPWMGRIAAERADFFVITEEDPRLEDPHQILDAIARGAAAAGAVEGDHFVRVPSRREAIREALCRARPGDTILLAGKGHESSIIGARDGRLHAIPWDERAEAEAALKELGYG